MVYSGSDKHNVSLSVSHNPNKRFRANARFNYAQTKVYGMGTSGSTTNFNKMEHIIQYRPTVGIYGEDSDLLIGEDPLLEDDETNPMQSPLVSAAEETKRSCSVYFRLAVVLLSTSTNISVFAILSVSVIRTYVRIHSLAMNLLRENVRVSTEPYSTMRVEISRLPMS